jgi:two-component system OmpR family response regulator
MLSAKEFSVLAYLMRHPEEVITRTRLAEHVWDEQFDSFSNVIDVTVYHLREKVDRGFGVPLIHTVRGSGYLLRLPAGTKAET